MSRLEPSLLLVNAIQRDVDEQWAQENLMRFNKVMCKVLHLGSQYKLPDVRMEHSPARRELELLVDGSWT